MTTQQAHSLQIRNLRKHYGAVRAVDDVSFTVKRGDFLTLLGPSGSGKTTVLMAIAGFVDPTSGDILVDDRVITGLPPEKRNFGMVFQGYALFPHLTVAGNVAFPLEVRKLARADVEARVKQALDLVQLGHLGDRLPKQLSGGQQQRVALARALVFQPELLLLDEPLSALDKKLRAELQWELKSLHQRVGMTFIYVTHDQDEALSMSDEVAIMREGKLVQSGAPGALYDRPRTRFVADFLGKSNFLPGKVEGREGSGFAYAAGGQRFVQAGHADGRQPGDAILVALRPEKVSLGHAASSTARNRLQAEIVSWSYFGTGVHFLVKAPGIGELTVTRPSWRLDVPLEAGAKVWLAWDADATIPVADD
ncbi:MAG: ABC transporter ATP-binding protein [Alphaproteobacteria bacterium]|nr:ABC transporter ATP-binding protein [Alphaproteobacteria bacterium]